MVEAAKKKRECAATANRCVAEAASVRKWLVEEAATERREDNVTTKRHLTKEAAERKHVASKTAAKNG